MKLLLTIVICCFRIIGEAPVGHCDMLFQIIGEAPVDHCDLLFQDHW